MSSLLVAPNAMTMTLALTLLYLPATSYSETYTCDTEAWTVLSPNSIQTGKTEESKIIVDTDNGWMRTSDSNPATGYQGSCAIDGSILHCTTGIAIRYSSENDDPYFEQHLSVDLKSLQFIQLTHYFGSSSLSRAGFCTAL